MTPPATSNTAANTVRPEYEDPRVTRSRALIVAAGSRMFLDQGYAGTSMDDIATEAGVSKRTLYNIFEDKEQLFRRILGEAIATAERFSTDLAATLTEATEPAPALTALAGELAASIFSGRVMPLRRLLIGEARRFPEFAVEYYDRAPGRVMSAVAAALRTFAERGDLQVTDPDEAAEHFAFLVIGASLDRALFDVGTEAGDIDAAVARAERGAAAFLRAYAV